MTTKPPHSTGVAADGAPATGTADGAAALTEALVDLTSAGQRLDRALAALMPALSRTRIQAEIRLGTVLVDGRPAKAGQTLQLGQRITLGAVRAGVETPIGAMPPIAEAIPLPVVYEDAHLLVVNKPAGMVVHPAVGHARGTLVNALLAYAPEMAAAGESGRPGIVHRLDKDTSGLLVVARDAAAHAALARQMAEHSTIKRYLALVEGRMPLREATIDAPIGRDQRQRQRMAIAQAAGGGREARTHYRVVREARGRTLLQVQPETGRTHQIRVHLAAIGHPVVGDLVYGRPQWPLPPRMFLHATHLELTHPVTGARMAFDAPLPADLAAFLAAWDGEG